MKKVLSYLLITFTLFIIGFIDVNAADIPACQGQQYKCIKCTYTYTGNLKSSISSNTFYYVVAADGKGGISILDKDEFTATDSNILYLHINVSKDDFYNNRKDDISCPDLYIHETDNKRYRNRPSGSMNISVSTSSSDNSYKASLNAETNGSSFSSGSNNGNIGSSSGNNTQVIDDMSGNCRSFAGTIRIGGFILVVVKILLPLIIIIKASLGMLSVVTSGTPDELKKKLTSIFYSVVAGVAIFFVPTLVRAVFGTIVREETTDSKVCMVCMFNPFSMDCRAYVNSDDFDYTKDNSNNDCVLRSDGTYDCVK